MRVLKFGGSSLATAERIKSVAKIISGRLKGKSRCRAIVVSALGESTDLLMEACRKASKGDLSYKKTLKQFRVNHDFVISGLFTKKIASQVRKDMNILHNSLEQLLQGIFLVMEATPRTIDYALSFGERSSAMLICAYLDNVLKLPASYVDARDLIKTNKDFGNAQVDPDLTYSNLRRHFRKDGSIQVITGFISSAKGGLTTTLGRGGSDYTASLVGAAIGAKGIEIWTDVAGVLTADPTKVSSAFTIPTMTYAEAVEMSHFGAKVIYPPTMQPALKAGIPIYIKNTFDPLGAETCISDQSAIDEKAVKGISSMSDVVLLTLEGSGLFGVPGIAGRLFNCLASAGINIILITQGSSEHSISFAIFPAFTKKARKQIHREFELEIARGTVSPINVEHNLSIIAIIGENMRFTPGIAGKMLTALGNNGINAVAIAQGSSELNISVVVNKENESKAQNVLHEAFFLSDTKIIHLFMVGVGLIGGTLIKQLQEQAAFLRKRRSLEIKVVGLANTKKMIFDSRGIKLNRWKSRLSRSATKSDMDTFVEQMIQLNLSNSVFVDNTADLLIPDQYEKVLRSSISISTPNKIATSSDFSRYMQLQALAERKNVYFGYETNVGAGLPVISTLRNLVVSGDRILKIEGVLSGSLSFIFNRFGRNTTFSQAVSLAGKKGFTEPDPRIDLNGVDVKRKLLILAREAGFPMEVHEVDVENILPNYCQQAKTQSELKKALERADPYFEKLRLDAEKTNRKLRVIAKLAEGRATIRLQSVSSESPFYFLSGSDNMIVFTTDRYKERPLVVQGPGAGAEVTAAGVFAEIVHIGSLI
ncbi:MAG: bifunctional aspartate kinase/homoserine dehydrogenase I [Saprospiraceae bacterium]|nr:bifunctional aspartate kinase/homoserine dehydrogenase I [Saprospiraceae bacterium]